MMVGTFAVNSSAILLTHTHLILYGALYYCRSLQNYQFHLFQNVLIYLITVINKLVSLSEYLFKSRSTIIYIKALTIERLLKVAACFFNVLAKRLLSKVSFY